jgi:hypothetical protein
MKSLISLRKVSHVEKIVFSRELLMGDNYDYYSDEMEENDVVQQAVYRCRCLTN